jgi:N-acetyl-D-muramate 6-phosphate phosphatase
VAEVPALLRAVLFDLDGTLLDTALDMVGALDELMRENDLPPIPYEQVRSSVSHGARRVILAGFPHVDAARSAELQGRYLEIYRAALSVKTRLFEGMEQVLDELDVRGLKTGIVTNKAAWLSEPLLEELGLRQRFACLVSGDTLTERKPHPLPLLHAAALLGVNPVQCVYVGDALGDIQAAQRAGMPVLVAGYGYIGADEDTRVWGADGHLERPLDLLAWIAQRERP